MKKRMRLITFWVGVNIIGLPQFVDHKFNRADRYYTRIF
jgi:hypothetical protein